MLLTEVMQSQTFLIKPVPCNSIGAPGEKCADLMFTDMDYTARESFTSVIIEFYTIKN